VTALAFFDDYPNEDLGHHPELILGMAGAAATALPGTVTPFLCPRPFVAGRAIPGGARHIHCQGPLPYTSDASRENVRQAIRVAREAGAGALVNLFLDENFRSFPPEETGVRLAHVLHRPGPAPRGPSSPRIDLSALLGRDSSSLVVVHTARGEKLALEAVPRRNLARIGWPAATREAVTRRFGRARSPGGEPYVLLIGGARDDKGADCLMRALESGPLLWIVGEQPPGAQERLSVAYPATRVRWDTGWATNERIGELIEGAALVVFPYEKEFGVHGGASAALAQALTYPKPIVLSTVLEDQAPASDGCMVVPAGDAGALRRAIARALDDSEALHEAALGRREHVLREHTYESHVEELLGRLST
jgi:glycosyltransferase involved in cell wall biosynthesis